MANFIAEFWLEEHSGPVAMQIHHNTNHININWNMLNKDGHFLKTANEIQGLYARLY
jgi:hypothetical protein